jgi:hypothetical protein
MQIGFISLNQTMTPFISKEHILLILKLIQTFFVTLNVLNVELQKYF